MEQLAWPQNQDAACLVCNGTYKFCDRLLYCSVSLQNNLFGKISMLSPTRRDKLHCSWKPGLYANPSFIAQQCRAVISRVRWYINIVSITVKINNVQAQIWTQFNTYLLFKASLLKKPFWEATKDVHDIQWTNQSIKKGTSNQWTILKIYSEITKF